MSTAAPEPSVFTRIINGEIPGRFVWADDVCVAFATIEPQTPGHVLVVPREQVTTLIDADEATVAHLAVVARRIAATQVRVFVALRPGIVVVGLDVPHLHVHVLPLNQASDVNPASARPAEAAELDAAMETLRAGLREDGWGAFVPALLGSAALA
ncbi:MULTISPECIES: HIT family protein [Actinomyces]|uniref:HIT family protein n=1 Tax=Actinomyces respiraculi TaxID=2744574 RepID=A0A7T0LJA2_9ACTO|nr:MULTISPECIES: HIT family protein [Actinomyces]QPL04650.1 HIT family protein [Actinomyces respiraculi]